MYTYDRRIAVEVREDGGRYILRGAYRELEPYLRALKGQGWRWDAGGKFWWIPVGKLTERQLTGLRERLGLGGGRSRVVTEGEFEGLQGEALRLSLRHFRYERTSHGPLLLVLPYEGALGAGIIERGGAGTTPHEGVWAFEPHRVTEEGFRGLMKAVVEADGRVGGELEAARRVVQEGEGVYARLGLRVEISSWRVVVSGRTQPYRELLRRVGLIWRSPVWMGSLGVVGKLHAALEATSPPATEAPQRGEPLATERQVAYALVLLQGVDWRDTEVGQWMSVPPTEAQLRKMTRRQISEFIDGVKAR